MRTPSLAPASQEAQDAVRGLQLPKSTPCGNVSPNTLGQDICENFPVTFIVMLPGHLSSFSPHMDTYLQPALCQQDQGFLREGGPSHIPKLQGRWWLIPCALLPLRHSALWAANFSSKSNSPSQRAVNQMAHSATTLPL